MSEITNQIVDQILSEVTTLLGGALTEGRDVECEIEAEMRDLPTDGSGWAQQVPTGARTLTLRIGQSEADRVALAKLTGDKSQ